MIGFQFEVGEVTVGFEETAGSVFVMVLLIALAIRRCLEFLDYIYIAHLSAPTQD